MATYISCRHCLFMPRLSLCFSGEFGSLWLEGLSYIWTYLGIEVESPNSQALSKQQEHWQLYRCVQLVQTEVEVAALAICKTWSPCSCPASGTLPHRRGKRDSLIIKAVEVGGVGHVGLLGSCVLAKHKWWQGPGSHSALGVHVNPVFWLYVVFFAQTPIFSLSLAFRTLSNTRHSSCLCEKHAIQNHSGVKTRKK